MWRLSCLMGVAALVAAWPATGQARVLCEKRSGVVVVRDACKRKETPLDVSQFGAVGPQGLQGPPGPPGQVAVYAVETTAEGFFDPLTSLVSGDAVASLTLPAGSYLFMGEVRVTSEGGGEWYVGCRIAADQNSASSEVVHPSGVDTLSVHYAGSLAVDGTATLRCGDSLSQPAQWSTARLIAVPVIAINPP